MSLTMGEVTGARERHRRGSGKLRLHVEDPDRVYGPEMFVASVTFNNRRLYVAIARTTEKARRAYQVLLAELETAFNQIVDGEGERVVFAGRRGRPRKVKA